MRFRLPVILGAAALVATAVSAAPAPVMTVARAAGTCTPGADWPAQRSDLASQVVQLVNDHRAGMGLVRLTTSTTLTNAAVWKARHMARYGYMAHDDPAPPVARTTAQRFADCGYAGGGWGENIAYGYPSAQSVVQGWLGSPGHRQNIETAAFRSTGVGAAASPSGVLYWAQTFGTAAGDGGGGGGGGTTAPTVRLTGYPASRTAARKATFTWTTTGSPATATCSIDGGPATACSSPKTYTGLGRKAHTFRVTVSNGAGSASASYGWTRVRKAQLRVVVGTAAKPVARHAAIR